MTNPRDKQDKNDKSGLGSDVRSALQRELQRREMGREPTPAEVASKEKEKVPVTERNILWRLETVDLRQINGFTRELSILLRAGMPLLRALKNLAQRTGGEKFRHVIRQISIMVENGETFWKSLGSFPRVFSKLYVGIVRVGETSGQLETVLSTLSTFGENEYMLRRKIRGALIYPAFVVIVAIAVVFVLSTLLVPVFAEMFAEFDAQLPVATRVLLASRELQPLFWGLLVGIVVFLTVIRKLMRNTYGGRLLLDRAKLNVPLFGGIHLKLVATRFARTFATLINSGIPILEALSITRDALGNEVVALNVDSMRSNVEKGKTMETALRETTLFPPLVTDMLIVGEEAGTLGEVLTHIADVYDEEVDSTLANLVRIMEPCLILAMGVLVAFVLYSFFVPYIDLFTAIGEL